jgi:hypothetical protein
MDSLNSDTTYVTQARGAVSTPTYAGSILNKPFVCWAEGTGFNGGWSCDVYVTYAYTKVL